MRRRSARRHTKRLILASSARWRQLNLGERTVEIHRATVIERTGARSVAHLVKMHMSMNSDVA